MRILERCRFVFPIANIMTSIPVFSIIIRYNLLQLHGVHVPVWVANLFAVVLPWICSLFFFPANLLTQLINWASVCCCSCHAALTALPYCPLRRRSCSWR
jgi:hypothetical protein